MAPADYVYHTIRVVFGQLRRRADDGAMASAQRGNQYLNVVVVLSPFHCVVLRPGMICPRRWMVDSGTYGRAIRKLGLIVESIVVTGINSTGTGTRGKRC